MENVAIEIVTIEHLESLQKIAKQTFFEAFSSENTEENMDDYLEKAFSTPQLKKELSDKNSLFYFALASQKIIGYLKLNFGQSQTDIKDEDALEIERIYVLKDFYGKKIGQLFFETAMSIAQQKKVSYVWLGVWEKNLRAIRFYERNGFKMFNKHTFMLGDDEQTDLMMKLPVL